MPYNTLIYTFPIPTPRPKVSVLRIFPFCQEAGLPNGLQIFLIEPELMGNASG